MMLSIHQATIRHNRFDGVPSASVSRWLSLRWLCLPLLAVGHQAAFGTLDEQSAIYLPLLLISLLSCALFLKSLHGSLETIVPLAIIFFILYVGNYFQLYWLVIDRDEIRPYAPFWIDSMTPEVLFDAYRQMAIVFAVSSVTAFVLHKTKFTHNHKSPPMSEHGRRIVASIATFIAVPLSIGVALLAYLYDINVVGRDADVPFRLAGWVQNIGRTSLPALLLAVIAFTDGLNRAHRFFWSALAIMFLSAFADNILSTSRAPIILTVLRLFVLFVAQERLSKRRTVWLTAIFTIGVLLFPIIGSLRTQRILGSDTETSIAAVRNQDSEVSQFSVPVMFLSRFSGANMLLPILRAQARADAETVLDGFVGGMGVTWFNTTVIHGFELTDRTAFAPSLLGYLYIAGGEAGQVIGLIVIMVILWSAWALITASRLRTRPVLQSLFAVTMFFLLSEGTIEGFVFPLAVIFTSVFLLEFGVYVVERKRAEQR